jgi:carotenoid cleavage dioxygenase
LDPCLVTHVVGAWEELGPDGDVEIVLYVCRYDAPEEGQPVDLSLSVVGPAGVGLSPIGGSLGVLERWRVVGDRLERTQVDERHVEYPRIDAHCEGEPFRYGYSVELSWVGAVGPADEVVPTGLLKFDLHRDELASSWSPGPWRRASEPIFVRAIGGHTDDEGWLLTVVDDANTGTSDLCVLDASSLGRRKPEAVIHLPVPLPCRSHGEWVPADRYR